MLVGVGGGPSARGHAELGEDVADVPVDRLLGHEQLAASSDHAVTDIVGRQPNARSPRRLSPLDRPTPTLGLPVAKDGPMALLSRRITKFVKSPQGQQLIQRAKAEAAKPENRRKLEQLRARYLNKRR